MIHSRLLLYRDPLLHISLGIFVVHRDLGNYGISLSHCESGRVSAPNLLSGPRWREFHCLAAVRTACALMLGFSSRLRCSCFSARFARKELRLNVWVLFFILLSHGAKHSFQQKICQPAESQVWRPCRASLVVCCVSLF